MGTPSIGSVVLLPFRFSDLSNSKKRPAVVVASAGKGDWILCQITSNPYSDPNFVALESQDSTSGGLQIQSFARPAKWFTANESLFISEAEILAESAIQKIRNKIIIMGSA
jgi:mRNA interferase MazF